MQESLPYKISYISIVGKNSSHGSFLLLVFAFDPLDLKIIHILVVR